MEMINFDSEFERDFELGVFISDKKVLEKLVASIRKERALQFLIREVLSTFSSCALGVGVLPH
jgi:hypothetical protein